MKIYFPFCRLGLCLDQDRFFYPMSDWLGWTLVITAISSFAGFCCGVGYGVWQLFKFLVRLAM